MYGVGETWVVDGQWEFTITAVQEHRLCNSYSNGSHGYTDEQVVNVYYHYKNVGYKDELRIYVWGIHGSLYDGSGTEADSYACTHEEDPKGVLVGGSTSASQSFVLDNRSDKLTLKMEIYGKDDSTDINKYTATFSLPIS